MFRGISLRHVSGCLALAIIPTLIAVAVKARELPVLPGVGLSGEVIIEVFPAAGGKRLLRETARGEALFEETAPGEITLTAKSETADRGGIRFSFRLTPDKDGIWRETRADTYTAMSADGRISGVADTGSDLITLGGFASEGRLQLEIRQIPHSFGSEAKAPDRAEKVEIRMSFTSASRQKWRPRGPPKSRKAIAAARSSGRHAPAPTFIQAASI